MYYRFILFSVILAILLLIVALFYLTIKKKMPQKKLFHILFWSVPLFFAAGFLFFKFGANHIFGADIQKIITWFLWLFVLILIPFLVFAIFYWLDLSLKFLLKKDLKLRYFIALPLILIFAVAYFQGTFNCNKLEIRTLTIEMKNLPSQFDGLKIAVLGDTHLGNFIEYKKYFNQIGNAINNQNVDLLLFTGDLVNTMPSEGFPFIPFFYNINAKYGKYAVMGNHDFCKYFDWSSETVRESMVYRTKALYRTCGFLLLENDHVILEKDSLNSLCIVGADETGDLQQTAENCPQGMFKILLLHNPKDWQTQIAENQDVALTISGHTHALQCEYTISGKKYSLAQLLFKQWDGLYNIGEQYLFVTRGVGFVGIPVRMGQKPEVSFITLKTKK